MSPIVIHRVTAWPPEQGGADQETWCGRETAAVHTSTQRAEVTCDTCRQIDLRNHPATYADLSFATRKSSWVQCSPRDGSAEYGRVLLRISSSGPCSLLDDLYELDGATVLLSAENSKRWRTSAGFRSTMFAMGVIDEVK